MSAGGLGANTALLDAASLVKIIAEEGISDGTMQKYGDQMWKRALPSIEHSAMGGSKLLGFKGFESAKEIEY